MPDSMVILEMLEIESNPCLGFGEGFALEG
jgi:hypothetical protein